LNYYIFLLKSQEVRVDNSEKSDNHLSNWFIRNRYFGLSSKAINILKNRRMVG
jgi:hypothetical protein